MPARHRFRIAVLAIVSLGFACLGACAPHRAMPQKQELENGQEVSEAAAKRTHEADIDALVLSSSSMDAPSGERDAGAAENAEDIENIEDAGLAETDADASQEDADQEADTSQQDADAGAADE